MLNNIDLFDYSLKNPEPLVDEFYVKHSRLIISNSPQNPNKLMEINKDLLNNITAFAVAKNAVNNKMTKHIIKTVQSLMKTDGINYSEFASFWSTIDVSYSAYKKLAYDKQLIFLRLALESYLDVRHNIYLGHGYSATTLQVGKDAKSHKSSGELGILKTADILDKHGYAKLADLDISKFKAGNKIYILSDKNGKKLFEEILKEYRIPFLWSPGHEGKMPDILFKDSNNFYIVEHKHMKEGGGGQGKQMTEVIDFINYSENSTGVKIHYVTFLDGSYFNLFTKKPINPLRKIGQQLAKINTCLANHQENYFVNTAGFKKLLIEIR